MAKKPQYKLSRRERQIMDVIYRLDRASVQDVLDNLADPPSYSAVRATLRILVEHGYLKHISDGPRYVYLPTQPKGKASQSALRHLLGDVLRRLHRNCHGRTARCEVERSDR